jgi:hypothetical protein
VVHISFFARKKTGRQDENRFRLGRPIEQRVWEIRAEPADANLRPVYFYGLLLGLLLVLEESVFVSE